jgi:hypothetical protein
MVCEIAIQWRNRDLEVIPAVYCAVCAMCDSEISNMLSLSKRQVCGLVISKAEFLT